MVGGDLPPIRFKKKKITGSAHLAVPFASYYKSCLIFSLKDGPDPEATTAM